MGLEISCVDRQGQGYDCRIYSVSNQNKRFNTLRLASKNWKTSNLEILKFEARAPHSSGQILAGFLRLSFLNFFQMTRLVKAFYSKGNLLINLRVFTVHIVKIVNTNLKITIGLHISLNEKKSRLPQLL